MPYNNLQTKITNQNVKLYLKTFLKIDSSFILTNLPIYTEDTISVRARLL